jgi:hypothetical protein
MSITSTPIISVARQTSRGLSAPFYHSVEQYSEPADEDSLPDSKWLVVQRILFDLVASEESACVRALNSKDYEERSPAHYALRTKDSDGLGHLLLKNIVLDRISYAIKPNANLQPMQIFFESPIELNGEEPNVVTMRNVFATYTNWTTTWTRHCTSWSIVSNSRSSDSPHSNGDIASGAERQWATLAKGLARLADYSDHSEDTSRIEANFSLAALGLLALIKVRRTLIHIIISSIFSYHLDLCFNSIPKSANSASHAVSQSRIRSKSSTLQRRIGSVKWNSGLSKAFPLSRTRLSWTSSCKLFPSSNNFIVANALTFS